LSNLPVKTELEATQHTVKFFEAILDAASDGIVITDASMNIIVSNRAFASMMGRPREEVCESNLLLWVRRFAGDAIDRWLKLESLVAANGTIPTSEFEFERDSGTTYLSVRASAVEPIADDEPGAMISIWRDVSDQRQSRLVFESGQKRLSAMFEEAPVGIALIDSYTGHIYEVNPRFAEIAGRSQEEMDNIDWMSITHPDDVQEDLDNMARLNAGEITRFDMRKRYLKPDGSVVWIHMTIAPVKRTGESSPRHLCMIEDITERVQVEKERADMERQMLQAQKLESLGVLAGGIAHDFNNILMSILGNADLAFQDLKPHSPSRSRIQNIETAARRAAGLSQQMLAYSGKGHFVVEPIDLNGFIEEMDHLLDVSISKSVVLKYNFADELPSILGDATQIRQILMNLIINASEATEGKSGVICITTGALDCDRKYLDTFAAASLIQHDQPLADGAYVFLEVADTGCGMDRETQDKIFDPFFTTKFTGRGLGMAAVLGIVRGHGGAIKVYSELGKGTTFKIFFPVNEVQASESLVQDTSPSDDWKGDGTLLLVDDEEPIRNLGEQMLERLGFNVITAADGREAVDLFREHSDEIVCVILDLTMPHMDGTAAFREMRGIRDDVKVIISSGYNEQDVKHQFLGKGLAGSLQKPYRMADLKKKLKEVTSEQDLSRD